MNYFAPRLSASCTSGAAMRMHQDILVAAFPEQLILASSPLAPARPVELAVLLCFWGSRFQVHHAPWLVNSPRGSVFAARPAMPKADQRTAVSTRTTNAGAL